MRLMSQRHPHGDLSALGASMSVESVVPASNRSAARQVARRRVALVATLCMVVSGLGAFNAVVADDLAPTPVASDAPTPDPTTAPVPSDSPTADATASPPS